MTEATVLVDRHGGVATITLNRPEQRNALTVELKESLLTTIRTLATDSRVRAVVIAGAGKAFCVGQDLGEHAGALELDASSAFDTIRDHYSPLIVEIMTMEKPVIAAVNGHCVGAGLGLALACDLRVFATDARFSTAFSAIGLTFDSGLSFTLPRAVGVARAAKLMMLGSTFGPEEAVAWGVDGEITAPAEMRTTAEHLATRLAEGPTAAFAATKKLLLSCPQASLADALQAEGIAQSECGGSNDHRAAVTAFLSREQPKFKGR